MFDHGEAFEDMTIKSAPNNALMREKIEKRMYKHVDRLLESFGRTNINTKQVWTNELFNSGYSPAQVKEVVDDLVNLSGLPSIGDVKKTLASKFKKKSTPTVNTKGAEFRASHERLRQQFIDQLEWTEKEFSLWTKYYCREVFGPALLECSFLKSFEAIALKDLVESNMNKERAIERGRRLAQRP